MPVLRVHLGHHFFGAGNLGDDLMIAGFLAAAEAGGWLSSVTLACPIPHDRKSQARRFPAIEWLPYDEATRTDSLARCDVWLGLGGSPFQTIVGTWLLDHLLAEAAWCERWDKPMFYLCVGVNDAGAADHPITSRLLGAAERVWTRDAESAAILRDGSVRPERITAAADLAHLALERMHFPTPEPGTLGLVLNFEDPSQFSLPSIATLVDVATDARLTVRWLAQEVRPLPDSERALYEALPPGTQHQTDLRLPDYAHAPDVQALLRPWGTPELLLTSRYHGALIGAWAGCRTVAFDRSLKVAAGTRELGLPLLGSLADPAAVCRVLDAATAADPVRLRAAADLARAGVEEFFSRVTSPVHRSRQPPLPGAAQTPLARLASVDELESLAYREFMHRVNRFAAAGGLREFTDWSKIWEYPWLWQHGLSGINWRGKRLLDLGSEISPLPWLLAGMGAEVTLIETDPQWVPRWEALREQLRVAVNWHLVDSERLPVADASVDVLTSFSVIEHQPDKEAAVAEVARVLRPGGLFAVSFDICEPALGMTFPAWNGRALTLAEFEEILWHHPEFDSAKVPVPEWNLADEPAFRRWHLGSAPHHNYVVGAAVLTRR